MLRRTMMGVGGGAASVTSWNPADMTAGIILSDSNRRITAPSDTTNRSARTVSAKSSGKWVLPIRVVSRTGAYVGVGIASPTATLPIFWSTTDGALYDGDGGRYRNGYQGAYGGAMGNGDTVEVLYDVDAGTVQCTRNGVARGLLFSSIPAGWKGAAYVSYPGAALEIIDTVSSYAVSNGYSLWD